MAAPSVSLLSWLRPETVQVAFADRGWQLDATTAADWLGAIAMDFTGLSGVFPGLVREDEVDDMFDLLRDAENLDGLTQIAQKVVQAAGGRDWWWTVNLTKRAMSNWILINGFLVRQGVRADSTSFPDWLDACYTFLWEKNDEEGRTILDMEIQAVPLGVRASNREARAMLEAFQAD